MGRIKHTFKTTGEKLLKPYPNKKGYLRVDIPTNKERKVYLVHRLVAQEFVIPGRIDQTTIDHINSKR